MRVLFYTLITFLFLAVLFTIGGIIYLASLSAAEVATLNLTPAEVSNLKCWDYIAIASFSIMLFLVYKIFQNVKTGLMKWITIYTVCFLFFGIAEIGVMFYKNSRVPIPMFYVVVSVFALLLLVFVGYIFSYKSLVQEAVTQACNWRFRFGEKLNLPKKTGNHQMQIQTNHI